MPPPLAFAPLTTPLSAKVLHAFRADAGWSGTTDDALAGAARPGSRVQWVTVCAGQKTVAIARLELAPPQFCLVSDLIVLNAWRGRGVGAFMMEHVERLCLAQRIPRVVLQPLGASRGFYAKLRYVDDTRIAGYLKKDLQPLRRRLPV